MRVVDISSFFSDACGGIKTYYREKARFMPRTGLDCHFVVPGTASSEEAFGGGVLHRLPGPRLPFAPEYRRFGRRSAVVDLLRRLAPRVVEVGSHYVLPGWVAEAAEAVGAAVVGFFHSDVPGTLVRPAVAPLPRPLRRGAIGAAWRLVRWRHGAYRATLVASRRLARRLGALGVPGVRWVGLGVDIDVFRPQARTPRPRPRVVYAGRLSPDKGFDVLLAALPLLHAASGAELVVYGDGPRRNALLNLARRNPAVRWGGCLQGRQEVAAALADADVAVAPGAHETFSLATAEALACGTPVVAANTGAARELVEYAHAGAVFRAGAPDSLREAALRLLALTPAERAAMGQRGRAHVQTHFSWPTVAGRIGRVYAEAIG